VSNPQKYKQSAISKAIDAYETLTAALGRTPSAEEVGKHLGVSYDWARNLLGHARRDGLIKPYVHKGASGTWEKSRRNGNKLRKLDEHITQRLMPMCRHLAQLIKSNKLPEKHESRMHLKMVLDDLNAELRRKMDLRSRLEYGAAMCGKYRLNDRRPGVC
jgi:transposase